MTQPELQELDTETLVKLYRTEASSHGKASFEGDYTSANKHHDMVAAIFRELRSRGLEAQSALLYLLEDPDADVRAWAGAHALEFAPDKGEPILLALSQSEKGLARLDAEMTLKEWKDGKLRFS